MPFPARSRAITAMIAVQTPPANRSAILQSVLSAVPRYSDLLMSPAPVGGQGLQ